LRPKTEGEAGHWLYMYEQFINFTMGGAKLVLTQAHDIHLLVAEIAHLIWTVYYLQSLLQQAL
jgi:hypothetical protein